MHGRIRVRLCNGRGVPGRVSRVAAAFDVTPLWTWTERGPR
jgi:hypothetical protein